MAVASKVDAKEAGRQPRRNRAETLERIRLIWPWAFLILLVAGFAVASKQANNVNFISTRSIQGILVYTTQILLIGLAETFIIITAGIDLSVGWTLGFASVVAAMVMQTLNKTATPPVAVIGAGALAGMLVTIIPGLVSGVLVARVKVPSFITTLGVGILVEGAALLLSKGYPIADQPDYLGQLGNGSLINWNPGRWFTFFEVPPGAAQLDLQTNIPVMPNIVFVTIVVTVICWFILAKTQFGQHLYAIGGNFEAALRAGIPVERTLIKVYILASVLAGVAGVLWAARFTSGAYNGGETTPLTAIAAVVIGGASLFGGEGRVVGTIVGALIIATIQYGLVVLGVLPFWQYIAVGIVLIIAVVVEQFGRGLTR